ncbi:MAG: hypothetical protein GVY23_03280 [Spirochaetes bacterium]|jgi:hypothetical protein|nr:hypothetical protein [Spirochaetota bacterium]
MDEYDELEAVLEEPFRRIEEQNSMRTEARMARMERMLDELERELDEFLSTADPTSVI